MEDRKKTDACATCGVCPWHSGHEARIEAICMKIEEKERKVEIQLNSMKDALRLAKDDLELRLRHLNDLRKELLEDRSTFTTIQIFNARREQIDAWRASVDQSITKLETRSITWGSAIALALVILNVVLHFWK